MCTIRFVIIYEALRNVKSLLHFLSKATDFSDGPIYFISQWPARRGPPEWALGGTARPTGGVLTEEPAFSFISFPLMDLIIDVALAPTDDAKLTPLEILEDFADASPGWHYLEDASRHYAAEKGQAACILRHLDLDGSADVDLAFSQRPESAKGAQAVHLTIVDPKGGQRPLDLQQRDEIVEHLLEHLRAHLEQQGRHAELHIERGDVEAAAKAKGES